LTDLAESGIPNSATLDTNGDGKVDNITDTDKDGIPDVIDGSPLFGDANNPVLPTTPTGIPAYLSPFDTDGDGVLDALDLDDDNDGILDAIENAQASLDTDGDGIPNRLDLDSDNDGINDVIEAEGTDLNKDGIADGIPGATGIPASAGTGVTPPDNDGDARPNPYDLDSDNDGIDDLIESGNPLLVDANGDGLVDGIDSDGDGILGAADGNPATRGDLNDPTPVDTDGTGGANYVDLDSDNDGLTDLVESGIPNYASLDSNGDGKIDNPTDSDKDGIPDSVDGSPLFGDANNPPLPLNANGVPNYAAPTDTDNDGITDVNDLDDDNDGILDTVEDAQANTDVDGDGIPNRLDLDSDNDGINDVLEASGIDLNKDGMADDTPNAQGIPASAGTGSNPPDSDGDTRPNPYDLDSDNVGTYKYTAKDATGCDIDLCCAFDIIPTGCCPAPVTYSLCAGESCSSWLKQHSMATKYWRGLRRYCWSE
jgi:large repetitive protein